MKKTAALILAVCLLIGSMLCACGAKEEKPFDEAYYQVSETYIAFLETAMKDWPEAVNTFVNLESLGDEADRVLSGTQIVSYEILRFEKLSDSLWVVEALTKTEDAPVGIYGVHYVGYVYEKWEVFLNVKVLPEVLTDGVEIPDYEIHSEGM